MLAKFLDTIGLPLGVVHKLRNPLRGWGFEEVLQQGIELRQRGVAEGGGGEGIRISPKLCYVIYDHIVSSISLCL